VPLLRRPRCGPSSGRFFLADWPQLEPVVADEPHRENGAICAANTMKISLA